MLKAEIEKAQKMLAAAQGLGITDDDDHTTDTKRARGLRKTEHPEKKRRIRRHGSLLAFANE